MSASAWSTWPTATLARSRIARIRARAEAIVGDLPAVPRALMLGSISFRRVVGLADLDVDRRQVAGVADEAEVGVAGAGLLARLDRGLIGADRLLDLGVGLLRVRVLLAEDERLLPVRVAGEPLGVGPLGRGRADGLERT